jgi:purine-cytosine permease-like protein
MQKDSFERIISFLLGASWGIILFGALALFAILFHFGFVLAFLITLLYIIVSLFLVLILDALLVNKQRLKEEKKQTELLQKLLENK